MCDEAVPLHFSESQSALACPTFCGLTCQDLYTAPAPCMELGTDKVVKSLIKYHTGENFCLENFAGLAIDHGFSARMVESLS